MQPKEGALQESERGAGGQDIIPVACGESGLIAAQSRRALVIAPGTNIADQTVTEHFEPGHDKFFDRARGVLPAKSTGGG